MNALTPSAQGELARYFEENRARLVAAGADPDEVVEDLRRRIEEELAGRPEASASPEEVRALLERFGPLGALPAAGVPAAAPAARRWAAFRSACFWLFGVALPLGTIAFELLAGWSAEAFFDPVPSFAHVVACLAVPAGQLVAWRALRRGLAPRWPAFAANGLAAGVSAFYSLLYLPLVPIGVVALAFGIGILPLTPHISLVTALVLRRQLGRRAKAEGVASRPAFWGALLAGLVLMVGLDLPKTLTRIAAARAANGGAADRQWALRLLRALGSEETLLRMCYVRSGLGTDALGALFAPRLSVGQAREVFFRATGRPFNAVPPPELRTLRGRRVAADEWDFEQGGTQVGQVRKGLSLVSSSIDGSVDAAAAIAYVEWTLEFRNDATSPAEARAHLALPPGAVVSRLTLWIGGEEREAAFAGRAQTRQAYESVVQRRRDPVLVTTAGRDRVLVQCFPVPAAGGTMKTRLGFTVPVRLAAADRGSLALPRLTERNFHVAPELRHAVWIESTGALWGAGVEAERRPDGSFAWRAAWSERDLPERDRTVAVARTAGAGEAWAVDARDGKEPAVVRQRLAPRERPAARLVVVVDGSAGVHAHVPAIGRALQRAPEGAVASVVVASDDVRRLGDPAGRAGSWAQQLQRLDFVGGQDNVPALEAAWDEADRLGGVLLWVHGPQPVALAPAAALRQRWERRPGGPTLVALPIVHGPNRVLEALDGVTGVEPVAREGTLEEDLSRVLREWGAPHPVWTAVRERAAGTPPASAPGRTSDHLVRLWARDEIVRLLEPRGAQTEAAIALATLYQLVTPVSGAVVLETAREYQQAGLTPAHPGEVPTIPEPETWALVAVALVALTLAWARNRRTAWTRAA